LLVEVKGRNPTEDFLDSDDTGVGIAVGITPRGMVDCMIAAVARRTGASLLSHDAGLVRIAHVIGIALDEASLRVP
jgi:predicted nucleic acid-binding protein